MDFPAFVIGPEHRGRGYGLLAASGPAPAGSWIVDLPLILLEWGKLNRSEAFSFCFPLGDAEGALIGRGAYLRQQSLGPEAYIHLVHCSAQQLAAIGFRSERVALSIAPPDAQTLNAPAAFAERSLALASASPAVVPFDWRGFGLAWADRLVVVADGLDMDEVLVSALASIDPPGQRSRVSGWMTTSELPQRGSLNPWRLCQLVLARDGHAAAIPWLVPGTLGSDGTFAGEAVSPPPSWQVWQSFVVLLADLPDAAATIAAIDWHAGLATFAPEALAQDRARAASGHLRPQAMVVLLERMIASPDSALREAGWKVLDEYLGALAQRGRASAPVMDLARSGRLAGRGFRLLRHLDPAALGALGDAEVLLLAQVALHRPGGRIADQTRDAAYRIVSEVARRCRSGALPEAALRDLILADDEGALTRVAALRGAWLVDLLRSEPDDVLDRVTRRTIGSILETYAASSRSAADARDIVGTTAAAVVEKLGRKARRKASDRGKREAGNG